MAEGCATLMALNGQESEKSARIYFVSSVVTCWRKREPIRSALAAARPVRYQDTNVLGLLHDDANR